MPAGVATTKPEPSPPTTPEPTSATVPEIKAEAEPTQAQTSSALAKKGQNLMLYVVIGVVAVLLMGICGLAVGGWLVFGREGNTVADEKEAVNQALINNGTPTLTASETEATLGAVEEVATPESEPTFIAIPSETPGLDISASSIPVPSIATNSPTPRPRPSNTPVPPLLIATDTPTPLPSDSPTPEAPQPIADTRTHFSGTQGLNNWTYQWSRDRESFNWVDMQFDGACWRIAGQESVTEPSVRICQNSAHPGVTGDIAWRWTSTVDGKVWVHISAYKIDTNGGDGVDVVLYHNTDELQRWRLNGNDSTGFSEGLSVDVISGDYIFAVLKIGGDSSYDETGFRAQIYP